MPGSGLAIASFVCSLVLCCPLTSVAAVILGSMALRRMRAAGEVSPMQRWALLGLWIGMLGLAAQLVFMFYFGQHVTEAHRRQVLSAVSDVVNASPRNDAGAAVKHFFKPEPTEAEVLAFSQALQERYGELRDVSITATVEGGTTWQRTIDAALTFQFHDSRKTGSASFRMLLTSSGSLAPDLKLTRITVNDPDDSDVVVGQPASTPPLAPLAPPAP